MTVSKSKRPLIGWSGETVSKDGKTVFKTPMWNDPENIPDPNARNMEQQVEMRCKTKRLADYELPEGFRLVTPRPRQYWLDQQLRWSFELGFGEHSFVARYDQQVADDIQMQWAVADFTAELLFKGVSLNPNKKRHETTTPRTVARTVLS